MDIATMPLALGGLGLRSAIRRSAPAYWASWADCLSMIHKRHPTASATLVRALEGQPDTPFLKASPQCQRELTGTMDFVPPSWEDLARGAMPPQREPEDREPGTTHCGWQHEASIRVEGELFSRTSAQIQALIRSKAGPGAGAAFTVTPTNRETTIPSHLFRVVALRRLRQVLPLSARSCRCGRPLDPCGHHRAACAEAGMLGRRGYAFEIIMARICRKAGGRVRTNLMIRDMDVPAPNALDGRRLEVVVDCLPVRGWAQVAIDTTMVCALHRDGTPRRRADTHDGVVLQAAWKRKERIHPELLGPHGRAQLVVVALEVGGRWSEETGKFVSALAIAHARHELPLMRKRAEQAWRMRWSGMLACTAARAVVSSLLDLQHCHGGDGTTPHAHEVDGDHRYAGLAPG